MRQIQPVTTGSQARVESEQSRITRQCGIAQHGISRQRRVCRQAFRRRHHGVRILVQQGVDACPYRPLHALEFQRLVAQAGQLDLCLQHVLLGSQAGGIGGFCHAIQPGHERDVLGIDRQGAMHVVPLRVLGARPGAQAQADIGHLLLGRLHRGPRRAGAQCQGSGPRQLLAELHVLVEPLARAVEGIGRHGIAQHRVIQCTGRLDLRRGRIGRRLHRHDALVAFQDLLHQRLRRKPCGRIRAGAGRTGR